MDSQTIITIVAIFITILTLIQGIRMKIRREEYTELLLDKVEKDVELRQTLAMGLYMRFKTDQTDDQSAIYLNGDPGEFEDFVTDIIETMYGGDMFVSKASSNYRIDFENRRDDGMYLGMLACQKDDLDFETVALMHSNIKKWNAMGGMIITTASFTENAIKYADGLEIDLISGIELVEMWLQSLQTEAEQIKQLNPSHK
ncbi:restriction endonuclease [Halalkalibacter akibai]|uniref:5-methylcytosine-specific restriction enzyme MRR n=1 Tax=Halalkalibacter akibai (strain ATCC 43226 / DSM 21942 / CIP 109018 / JCM 9157 / 1139) TaxID=1236973 RepID=W4QSS0_HALA3|nr:restriction endonuclease [Halalkalibacter akibai]GAE34384.1 5-methylcytosine-specific restriction enzyme MRR [Halalkalibacter akibai JCM 9157]